MIWSNARHRLEDFGSPQTAALPNAIAKMAVLARDGRGEPLRPTLARRPLFSRIAETQARSAPGGS
jgi:hypothetical protein